MFQLTQKIVNAFMSSPKKNVTKFIYI